MINRQTSHYEQATKSMQSSGFDGPRRALVGHLDVLAEEGEDAEGDANIEGDTDHSRPGAGEEEGGALVLHDLHGAVHGALVQFLRLLALHSGLDGVLRHRDDDRHGAGCSTGETVVDGGGHLLLVVTNHQLHDVELSRESHSLVGGLLGDGGHDASVQTTRPFVLQDLHEGIQRSLVVASSSSHVVRDTSLQGLDGSHGEDSLSHAAAGTREHSGGNAQVALVVLELVGNSLVSSPPGGLLAGGADDQGRSTGVETHEAILRDSLPAAVKDAGVLRVGLGLELELSLHKLGGVADNGLDETSQETLHEGADGSLTGVGLQSHLGK
mmetsp:Transcript_8846/g.13050  ORF Transcript_8846/g.13050 Transcript_8846/m.13050 type:complete len:326 (+) Transcript_8846:271-1248(+)